MCGSITLVYKLCFKLVYRKDSRVEVNDEVSCLISLLEKETNID